MLVPNNETSDNKTLLLRGEMIKFLKKNGILELQGKPLEDCYTYELLRAIASLKGKEHRKKGVLR
jgi:hypothetical protein